MRDNHDGCPEILDAYEWDGLYFGSVGLTIANGVASFEFGVERRGYISLKQILQTRPFDALGKYRYFFTGGFSKREPGSDRVRFDVRIEQGANGQNFKNFNGPSTLVSNLLWFKSLKNLHDAGALKRLT
jgi:hypothetical protein